MKILFVLLVLAAVAGWFVYQAHNEGAPAPRPAAPPNRAGGPEESGGSEEPEEPAVPPVHPVHPVHPAPPALSFSSCRLVPVHGAEVVREGADTVRLRMRSAEWSCGLRLDPPEGRRSLDLSGARWLALDVENLSPDRQMRLTMHVSSGGANSEAADHAVANFTKNRSINTGIGLAPGEKGTMRLLLPHPEVCATPDGAPGPFLVDTHRVNAIELQCQWPFEDEFRWVVDCRLSNLRLEGEPAAPFPKGAAFFPFIDRYGQFRHAEWPEKVHSDADLRADLAREEAALAASPRPASWDRFGGWKDGPRLRATGAFRTELVDGKWWLVTPEGHLFFSTGIDVVRNNTDSPDGSKHPDWYASPVPPDGRMPFPDWNLRLKFGKDDYLADYYAFAQRRLPAWGINTVGNWSGRELLCAAAMPYVVTLGENEKSIPHVPGGLKFYDVFDQRFVPALRTHIAKRFREDPAARRARTDPLCIGFFFDNELQFNPCVAKALAAPFAECAAKRELLGRARKRYVDVAALNAAWGTSFADWEAVKAISAEPKGPGWREDRNAFLAEWFERYFRAVKEAIAAEAPGRLYLGCRFVGFRQSSLLWDAAAKHCDVVSVNAYANSIANLPKAAVGIGKPILLGEFHFGCLDRGMFRASLCPVGDQAERGRSYARLVEGALSHPLLVGCHWFQYRDQPLVGRGDGEAYQCGFVDGTDRPYEELCAAARAVGENMYRYRWGHYPPQKAW